MLAAGAPAASLLGTFPAAAGPRAARATAPLPPGTVGPTIPQSGYLTQEIADNLYWLTDGIYQMMFMVTSTGVIAVDAPPSLGNNISRAIRAVTNKNVNHAVYSHHHADHVGAMALYPASAKLWAHEDTAEILRRVNDPNRPVPSRTFQRMQTIHSGGQTLQLQYRGPNHSPGNLFVYAPKQRVLMLVDVIFPGWVPFAYLAVSSDIPGWINAHQKALGYPFQTLVGGHLTRLGTRADVQVQHEYIQQLRARTLIEISNVDLAALYGSVDPANVWAVFEGYLDAVATQASEYLEPRWVKRLGGADVFTYSNARAMAQALRNDYGHLGPFGIHV